jgi:hypothetical protein
MPSTVETTTVARDRDVTSSCRRPAGGHGGQNPRPGQCLNMARPVASLKFAVGKQFCLAKVSTEEEPEILSKFIQAENIPDYLQNPIKWSVEELLVTLKNKSPSQVEASMLFWFLFS